MGLYEVPKEVVDAVCEFPSEHSSKILKLALASSQSALQDKFKVIENLLSDCGISKERIYDVVGVYIALIRLFLETNDNEYSNRLLEMGFTPSFIDQLPLLGHREEIISNLINDTDFNKLSSFKWKIDISLSSSLVKKIPTSVVLCLVLKNGSRYTLEVDTKSFHKLRFNVALILKELTLLKSSALK